MGDSTLLEEIAIQFVNQSEATLQQIGLGLTVVGAIIAALVTRSKIEIARAPYFAYSALIFLLVSAAQIVWLQSLSAITGGYLWVFMLISLTGVGVISVNLARREDETVTFNAVATLLALGGSAMSVVGFGAQLLVIYRAFCEDIKQGLLVFFVPLYVLYYAVTRFDRVGKPLILSIVATSIAIGLFIASAASNQ